MKTGLIYATKTGHSRKIAQAIAQELNIEALDVQKSPKLGEVEKLFVVGGVYGGKCAPEMIDFIGTLKDKQVKRAVLVTSSASQSARQNETRKALESKGIEVTEEFKCRGSFLFVGIGHPNKDDINNAVAFAKQASQG